MCAVRGFYPIESRKNIAGYDPTSSARHIPKKHTHSRRRLFRLKVAKTLLAMTSLPAPDTSQKKHTHSQRGHVRLSIAESFPGGRGDAHGRASRACALQDVKLAPDPKPEGIRRGNRAAAIYVPGAGVARAAATEPPWHVHRRGNPVDPRKAK